MHILKVFENITTKELMKKSHFQQLYEAILSTYQKIDQ